MVPKELPRTEDELKASCPSELTGMINTLTEICEEDTYLHESYVRHMACIKGLYLLITNHRSAEITKMRLWITYENPYEEKQLQDDEEYRYKISQCLFPLLSMNCFVTNISGSCGYEAGNMTIELIKKQQA
ncbi:hypothetical protein CEXT_520191 [Caerostris extrusa]|uniref:Uncharacterized protein n=1 Tax=Caerostris extrusa TaxID=172846 RepID=A0AAV4QY18_CAEEX|nr:hypothetical protein CEXT_520191 [Caerostris extrusa]